MFYKPTESELHFEYIRLQCIAMVGDSRKKLENITPPELHCEYIRLPLNGGARVELQCRAFITLFGFQSKHFSQNIDTFFC